MPNDSRLYARFALDFADSHKIAPLTDAAFRCYVRMVLWSRRMLTDGKIPGPMALVLANQRQKTLDELTSNDPSQPSLWRDPDGDYWIHDFLEHQSSKAQVEAKQAVNRANGAKGGQEKARRAATATPSDSLANGYRTASERVADFYTESETETRTTDIHVSPVPQTADSGADGLVQRSRLFGFDAPRVRQELTRLLGEFPDDDMVMHVATTILSRAKRVPTDPTAYLIGSFRRAPQEAEQLAYGGAA